MIFIKALNQATQQLRRDASTFPDDSGYSCNYRRGISRSLPLVQFDAAALASDFENPEQ